MLTAFGCGACLFLPDRVSWLALVGTISLITFIPQRRRFLLAAAPILLVVAQDIYQPLLLGVTLAVIALGICLHLCAMRWPKSQFGQRPLAFLLTGFSMLILLACGTPPRSLPYAIMWPLVGAMASYVWFIGYAITDRNSKPGKDLTLELAAFRPLWGSTSTPFPKGAAYLRRIEAQNPEQLAVVQLKGLKLLMWAILLALFQTLWNSFFHSHLGIPTATQALTMSVRGTPAAWHVRWESQILAFFEFILSFSILGHRWIASCRMAGYNALRNTYRPLSSTTISQFFNRFYYYFKELLVDFFFYPTFLRYWKGHRRLRIVFATFAAAFFGIAFFHFTRDWQFIRDDGLWGAILNYQVFLFYCFILAAGLSISQLRKRGPKPQGFVRGQLIPSFGVGLFFCLLDVFGSTERNYSLVEHLKYLASLFFIHF
jgi:hypothetical protein